MGLALHVSSPGLALRIERVEVLLEAVLGRDTGVDGAAQRLRAGFDHRPEPFWSRTPEKRGPFQRVPVIARATLEPFRIRVESRESLVIPWTAPDSEVPHVEAGTSHDGRPDPLA